ncbi:type VI secretion system-associated protein TagF [Aliiruegeria sabulilitoris]|uniref:type VI secretion system-associated protein TagF n=1 Tax=Aliiruegeria sabulilitoris TaxID=1510458 RepID=UPI00082F63CF|nr:type VI secretion system-associated protein TagF [Aliiruegeria sabulilitoris]
MPDEFLMSGIDLLGPVGAFGKMPSQGDFFWIDLPAGFAVVWDKWLSNSLKRARGYLGERWQECYYTAPIWRFTLAPGVVANQALLGVLMPSVDRVGRAFPLTLTMPVGASAASPLGHMSCGGIFDALETLALDALDFSMTQDALRRRLGALKGSFMLMPESDAPSIPEAFTREQVRGYWSALVGERTEFLGTSMLPAGRQLAAMFDPSDECWSSEAVL